jgi:hypothetical protein
MKDCELFAPSGLIQSCARSSVTSYALGLQSPWGNYGFIYSSREGTVASFTAVVRKRRAWFTAVVRERPLSLQQPINSQLSMLVIVLHLISTGSNLYSWGGLFLYLKYKVAVCDRKTIACYRERTAITSPNRSRHEQRKKAAIWPKKSGVCWIFSDTIRENAVPAKAWIIPVFVQQMPDFIRHLPDFSDPQKIDIF